MRTLGINISHNASICQVTDGKIDFYYEEDRFNKRKYYAPKHDDCYFKVIDEKVKDKATFKEIANELNSFIEGCDLAGYNSNRFDIPLIAEEFLRAGIDFDVKSRNLIDVQNIFHKMEQRTLVAAYKFYSRLFDCCCC